MSSWTILTDPRVRGLVETHDPLAAILDDLVLRLTNPQGLVTDEEEGSENEGLDLTVMLGESMTPAELASLASEVEAQCLMDPRVTGASATVDTADRGIVASVDITTEEGRFALRLALGEDGLPVVTRDA